MACTSAQCRQYRGLRGQSWHADTSRHGHGTSRPERDLLAPATPYCTIPGPGRTVGAESKSCPSP
eukprot:scaffold418_cov386-Prasinococcus_capsulatus_cf.AAC.24